VHYSSFTLNSKRWKLLGCTQDALFVFGLAGRIGHWLTNHCHFALFFQYLLEIDRPELVAKIFTERNL